MVFFVYKKIYTRKQTTPVFYEKRGKKPLLCKFQRTLKIKKKKHSERSEQAVSGERASEASKQSQDEDRPIQINKKNKESIASEASKES